MSYMVRLHWARSDFTGSRNSRMLVIFTPGQARRPVGVTILPFSHFYKACRGPPRAARHVWRNILSADNASSLHITTCSASHF